MRQNLGSFTESENFVFKFSLIVDQVPSFAVLEDKIVEFLVFFDLIQFNDVGRVHLLHALNLSVEILFEMGFLQNHSDRDEFQSIIFAIFGVFYEIYVSVGSLAQSLLVLEPV